MSKKPKADYPSSLLMPILLRRTPASNQKI